MPNSRAINFSAGPAGLPTEVLEKAQADLLNWQNTGASVMEISHRSAEFTQLHTECLQRLRQLLQIPDNYAILTLQGGARLQFSMLPMNILQPGQTANYAVSGIWSELAAKDAKKICDVNAINTVAEEDGIIKLIPEQDWQNKVIGDYLHFTPNETINGIKMLAPQSAKKLIADMSSCILSEPINVSDYSVIYACAQKNMGIAGVTFVIIDKNLKLNPDDEIPSYLSYQQHIDNNSMLNTAPTFPIYMSKLVLDWLTEQGGVSEIHKSNQDKAAMLYDYIDSSNFYNNNIHASCRSIMNVPFSLHNAADNDKKFINSAKEHNIISIKGHRSVGGMRASLYNARSIQDVAALISFMDEFAQHNK